MIWLILACIPHSLVEDPPKEKLIQDYDQDGFLNDVDCDDLRVEVHPEAPEICDSIDNNCDGIIDDEDPTLVTEQAWYQDNDDDGFGNPDSNIFACLNPSGYVGNAQDCDDDNSEVHPNAIEVCDTIDNNCNSYIDDEDSSIPASELIAIILDEDGDGFGGANLAYRCTNEEAANNSLDCDDGNPETHPQASDYCDGVDNDCDGIVDPTDELILIDDDGNPQVIDVDQSILITEGAELHNCYDTISLDEQLGIQTSLSMYNHRENATLLGSILIYVNIDVNIYDLNIDVTGSFSNDICTESSCLPGLMCTMDANVLFSNGSIKNGSSIEGGNAYVRACTLTLENSDIFNGVAQRGGGVYVEYGSVELVNSYITGNHADQGAGIYIKEGVLTGGGTHISFNHAIEGGAIYAKETTGISTSILLQNNTAEFGAGIWTMDGDIEWSSALINDNIATQNGGGLFVSGGSLTLISSSVNTNIAEYGGHAWIDDVGSILWENTLGSYAQGGAVWIEGDGALTCSHTDSSAYSGFFSNNHNIGGAINISNLGTFTGIGCDMGVEGQTEDNFDTDIALFADGILIDTQEANNDANIVCTQDACNYQ